jgi:transglycosylase-like protein with SLT domain
MVTTGKLGTVTKYLIVFSNVLLFAVAVKMIDSSEANEEPPLRESHMPSEVMSPHVTVTKDMEIGMFFENLSIDHSLIAPRHIARSISPWEPYIRQYSKQYGVDADLVRAIIYAESKGDPFRISKDGALGLMQLMPSTAKYVGIDNALDPEENIRGGVKYIAWLVKHYDEEYALWAWNAGPSRIEQKKMPRETRRFITEVISVKTFLKNSWFNTI